MEFNEWTEAAIEEGILQKWTFFKMTVLRVSSWLHDQNLSKIPVKKFNFSKVADIACNFNKNKTLLQAYFNSFSTDLEQLACSI